MSHAYGQVRFPDGTIMHYEYNGTADVVLPVLRATAQEVSDHWRRDQSFKHCGCEGEEIEAATDYGGGSRWAGRACRDHACYLGPYLPDDGDVMPESGLPRWWQAD